MKGICQSLERAEGLSSVFHPRISQHNQIYLYNSQHSLEEMVQQDKNNYLPLNEANLILAKFCKRVLGEIGFGDKLTINSHDEAMNLLQRWRECYKTGELYNTFPLVYRIIDILRQADLSINEVILKDDQICKSFLNVTYHIKSFFQYHIIVPARVFRSWWKLFVDAARMHPSLFYYVRELTVYTSPVVLSRKKHEKYNIVRIKLLPEIVNSIKNPVLGEVKGMLTKSLASIDAEDADLDIYAEKIGSLLYLSQGNNNYKKFLNLLGLLPFAYDANNSYAYLRPAYAFDHCNN